MLAVHDKRLDWTYLVDENVTFATVIPEVPVLPPVVWSQDQWRQCLADDPDVLANDLDAMKLQAHLPATSPVDSFPRRTRMRIAAPHTGFARIQVCFTNFVPVPIHICFHTHFPCLQCDDIIVETTQCRQLHIFRRLQSHTGQAIRCWERIKDMRFP